MGQTTERSSKPTTVKICGLQQVAQLQAIAHLPIDQIGFMFAPSKRQIAPETAKAMIVELKRMAALGASIHSLPQTVGVFVNPSKAQLIDILNEAPLDIVQLHGGESVEFCRWVKETLGKPIYKVASVQSSDNIPMQLASLDAYTVWIDALLLDTYDPIVGGGTGKAFAWDCIPQYLTWARNAGIPLIIAGGLHPENVADLIAQYGPDGVDVSSGVETDGIKDVAKIQLFVERVNGS